MVGGDQQGATGTVRIDPATDPADAVSGAQQQLAGEIAQRQQHLGLDQLELRLKPGSTRLNLVRLWVPVARRPAFHGITDVDLGPLESQLFAEQPVQELTGSPDERAALHVLVSAWSLAH